MQTVPPWLAGLLVRPGMVIARSMGAVDDRYELRRGNEIVATGRLSRERPLEVGERFTIGKREGIVRTYQNFPTVGGRYFFGTRGEYVFNLTASALDARALAPGAYTLTVSALDTCGNLGTLTEKLDVARQPRLRPVVGLLAPLLLAAPWPQRFGRSCSLKRERRRRPSGTRCSGARSQHRQARPRSAWDGRDASSGSQARSGAGLPHIPRPSSPRCGHARRAPGGTAASPSHSHARHAAAG